MIQDRQVQRLRKALIRGETLTRAAWRKMLPAIFEHPTIEIPVERR
jgi:hypothetical protein